jgi:hypothetical protein
MILSIYKVHTYDSRFIPEGVAATTRIFLRDTRVLHFDTDGKPIAVRSLFISGVNAYNSLIAFYDLHARKGEMLFFCFAPDTTRDYRSILIIYK